jgi:hypothetical protein
MYPRDINYVKNHQDSSQEPPASSKTPWFMLCSPLELPDAGIEGHGFIIGLNILVLFRDWGGGFLVRGLVIKLTVYQTSLPSSETSLYGLMKIPEGVVNVFLRTNKK